MTDKATQEKIYSLQIKITDINNEIVRLKEQNRLLLKDYNSMVNVLLKMGESFSESERILGVKTSTSKLSTMLKLVQEYGDILELQTLTSQLSISCKEAGLEGMKMELLKSMLGVVKKTFSEINL